MPQQGEEGQAIEDTGAIRAYFDGTSNRKSHGACGFVIFDPQGGLLAGEGAYLGDHVTNNVAEARGAQRCFEALDGLHALQGTHYHVVIRGDS